MMIISGIIQARNVVNRLPFQDPVEIYEYFGNVKLEVILFAMALSKDRKKQKVISRYLTELRNVKTVLTGEDLKKMGIQPGPVYSEIFKELLEEKLRGHLKSREDEERFVFSKIK